MAGHKVPWWPVAVDTFIMSALKQKPELRTEHTENTKQRPSVVVLVLPVTRGSVLEQFWQLLFGETSEWDCDSNKIARFKSAYLQFMYVY